MIGMIFHVHNETKSDGMIGAGHDRSATKDEHCWLIDRGDGRS